MADNDMGEGGDGGVDLQLERETNDSRDSAVKRYIRKQVPSVFWLNVDASKLAPEVDPEEREDT